MVTLGSTFLGTLQPFWIALLLLYVFGYTLGWFPTRGGYEESTPGWNWPFIYDAFPHTFLPAVTLLIVTPIGWILGMRNTMVMNLGEDYIRLAKAKGLPDRTVALRYAARNALLPSVTGFAHRARRRARRHDPGRDGLRLPGPGPADGRGRRATRTTRCCRR